MEMGQLGHCMFQIHLYLLNMTVIGVQTSSRPQSRTCVAFTNVNRRLSSGGTLCRRAICWPGSSALAIAGMKIIKRWSSLLGSNTWALGFGNCWYAQVHLADRLIFRTHCDGSTRKVMADTPEPTFDCDRFTTGVLLAAPNLRHTTIQPS